MDLPDLRPRPCGLAATVIRYRAKSAMREVAKVMGLTADVQEALSRTVWGYGREGLQRAGARARPAWTPPTPPCA